MTTDGFKQLEQQVDSLISYCKKLERENIALKKYNRSMTNKLQKILAQFQTVAEQQASEEAYD